MAKPLKGVMELPLITLKKQSWKIIEVMRGVSKPSLTLSLPLTTEEALCEQCWSRSDCTERAVWSLIYTVHISILDYKWTVSSSFNGRVFLANESARLIHSLVKELNNPVFSRFWERTIWKHALKR